MATKKKMAKLRDETRVGVRSGSARSERGPGHFRKVNLAIVSGGRRPMLWLGGGEYDGIAWVCGRDTLTRIRDAITAALKGSDDAG